MTDVWRAFVAGSRTWLLLRVWGRVLAILVVGCLSASAVFVATLLVTGAPAGADQVSNLQAQAEQLSQQMLLEQLQIGGYEQQHSADLAQVAQDQQNLAVTNARMTVTRTRIGHDISVLDRAAVKAYINDGTTLEGANTLFSSDRSVLQRSMYEGVVTNGLSTALDHLRTDRAVLLSEQATQQSIVAAAQQAETQAATLLADAQSTQASLQAQSSSVNAQLAAAIAQVQAQEEAAAAAAAAQAQAAQQAKAAAADPAPARGSASTSDPAPVTSSAGALPPFLACVVQAESSGDYGAVSPTGSFLGAFQFSQSTWNEAALLAGRPTLVGVPPNQASVTDQNALALALYSADGEAPWYDPCRNG